MAEDISDLQDILCSMALSSMSLSDCVYKRPASEVVQYLNKFKADFGGQVISLQSVQISLDHVLHRYLLAEAGNTLFVSFIGTKHYKDVMVDANILQGAVFHEDLENNRNIDDRYVSYNCNSAEFNQSRLKAVDTKLDRRSYEPAVHKGFLARAKSIPALDLYRLAQKKNKRLVLCGHSLGGAVAVLVTLSILRAFASSFSTERMNKVEVKCITFSQPPVGNAALRDYVHRKGWKHHFRTYCIPEDLVPRILSPAYFEHYRAQGMKENSEAALLNEPTEKPSVIFNDKDELQMKMTSNNIEPCMLGPLQVCFNRLFGFVEFAKCCMKKDQITQDTNETLKTSGMGDFSADSALDGETPLEFLDIEENAEGVPFKTSIKKNQSLAELRKSEQVTEGKQPKKDGDIKNWQKMPTLPSYVPFGELYLLRKSSVESLSASEYTKLTSLQSIVTELKGRFQSHSMRSYRSRLHRIYELCVGKNAATVLGMEHLQNLPHLQQWLDLAVGGAVELGSIAEPIILRTAVSLVPLGWNGVPGDKAAKPWRVDLYGYSLDQCNLVRAQLNGQWYLTIIESLHPTPLVSDNKSEGDLQRMRLLIGSPVKESHSKKINSVSRSFFSVIGGKFSKHNISNSKSTFSFQSETLQGDSNHIEGLRGMIVHCSSDFITTSKEVCIRLRHVQLSGPKGAGKTTLFYALLGHYRKPASILYEELLPDIWYHTGVAGGVCFIDPAGSTLKISGGNEKVRQWGFCIPSAEAKKKIDVVIHVHNIASTIECPQQKHLIDHSGSSLSSVVDELAEAGIPSVLAITNKFAVNEGKRCISDNAIMEAYQMTADMTVIVNSSPYMSHRNECEPCSWGLFGTAIKNIREMSKMKRDASKLLPFPMGLIQRAFEKKAMALPVEGVDKLHELVNNVLLNNEESAFQDFAKERLLAEASKEKRKVTEDIEHSQKKLNSSFSAFFGASFGAGLGVIVAVIMGAASAFRKP